MTTLYKVLSGELVPVERKSLASEETLENWIAKDPNIIGLDVLILGRQVVTDFKGRIDILAIDREGSITIVELKRDRTPREVVAQVLDYASWIAGLTPKRIHDIAFDKLGRRLEEVFRERFDTPLPENLNNSHTMVIVASEFDASSKRIVEYLAEKHDVSINTAFFNVFEENGQQFLATDWLMDQQEVVDRAESRKKLPWTGLYYVNAGDDPNVRDWEDMRRYGFISAGYGRIYSGRLNQLSVDDLVYVYQKGAGYIGYGTVTSTAVMSKDFVLPDGKHLSEVELRQSFVLHDPDNTADIAHIPSKFVEIVALSHRQGNCIPYAAIRWHDFGNRPALGRPLGHFSRHPDTPLLSLSPRRRFPRPTPERVFVADHQSSSGFSGTGPSAPPPQPIGT